MIGYCEFNEVQSSILIRLQEILTFVSGQKSDPVLVEGVLGDVLGDFGATLGQLFQHLVDRAVVQLLTLRRRHLGKSSSDKRGLENLEKGFGVEGPHGQK